MSVKSSAGGPSRSGRNAQEFQHQPFLPAAKCAEWRGAVAVRRGDDHRRVADGVRAPGRGVLPSRRSFLVIGF